MIDLKARSLLAAAIDSYLDNRCDNFELDDTFFSIKTTDELVLEIRRQLWFFYDDTYVHKIADKMALSPEYRAAWRRWVYLLHTDAEWHAVPDGLAQSKEAFPGFRRFLRARLGPKPKALRNPYWPFENLIQWHEFVAQQHKVPPPAPLDH